jgi:hypothetical protein
VRDGYQPSGSAGSNDQFKRAPVRVNRDAVEKPQLLGDSLSQLIDAFKEAVGVQSGGDHIVQSSSKLRMKRYVVLALHQIASWWN